MITAILISKKNYFYFLTHLRRREGAQGRRRRRGRREEEEGLYDGPGPPPAATLRPAAAALAQLWRHPRRCAAVPLPGPALGNAARHPRPRPPAQVAQGGKNAENVLFIYLLIVCTTGN